RQYGIGTSKKERATMSEQLWFTWDTSGLSGNNGFQIRAISRGVREKQGVNTRSTYYQNILKYLDYSLPSEAKNFSSVDVQKAPLCLAYIWTGEEYVLVQRSYIDKRDTVARQGVCFSHALTHLQPVRLETSQQLLPFS